MARITIFRSLFLFLLIMLSACHGQHQNIAPTISPSKQAARVKAHLVFNYLHQGYTDKAYEKLQAALYEAPDDPVILDTAGYYYEKTGRLKKANRYYKQAVIQAPYSGITKNNYGAFLCRNGFYKQSLPLFLEASKSQHTPVTQEAYKNWQYCKLKMQTRLGGSAT